MGRWTATTGWDALDAAGADVFAANPTLLTDVLAESRARGRRPRGLRVGVSGGGSVPLSLKRAWRDELALPLTESYGQSELGGFVALGAPLLIDDTRLAAIGTPLPDKDVRVLAENDGEVPIGATGELCIRGGFMLGYWARPEKTAETTRNGWLHTGDVGVMDADGYVTLRGRLAERVVVDGEIWFPRDIEEALLGHHAVRQAALVGVPDPELGQRPIAYVTLYEPDPAGADTALAHAARVLQRNLDVIVEVR
jgi:acyl-CoA synthetase (AMP-forming)/AMP-acid ligase II